MRTSPVIQVPTYASPQRLYDAAMQRAAVSGVADAVSALAALSSVAATASEILAAPAAIVSFWASGVRNASAADATKRAHGFVLGGAASGAAVTVYLPGAVISGLAGLTHGAHYWLDPVTPGAMTAAAPTTPGQLEQFLGVAADAATFVFAPERGETL